MGISHETECENTDLFLCVFLTQQTESCLFLASSFYARHWSPEQPCPSPAARWYAPVRRTLRIYPSPGIKHRSNNTWELFSLFTFTLRIAVAGGTLVILSAENTADTEKHHCRTELGVGVKIPPWKTKTAKMRTPDQTHSPSSSQICPSNCWGKT